MKNTLQSICHKPRSGFTLVEIMVVVVIIGILASLGVPLFSKMRGSAQQQAVAQNLRALVTAANAYFADQPSQTQVQGAALTSYLPTTFNSTLPGNVPTATYNGLIVRRDQGGSLQVTGTFNGTAVAVSYAY